MLEDLQDLHLHFDDFKNSTEKDFKFLKEATLRNAENFQTSLNFQQTFIIPMATLCVSSLIQHEHFCQLYWLLCI